MINFRIIAKVVGVLLIIIGLLMFTGIPFSLYFEGGDTMALLLSGGVTVGVGLLLQLLRPNTASVQKREGYLIVGIGWISMVIFGMLPFILSGSIPDVTGAFFETMSGMTTTGASVLEDIESVPEGILFWRSMTQWIGGMGIIVLTVALFPLLGIGGIELFVAEAPGPTSDKIHPRIRETAKRLWLIYVSLTILLAFVLFFGGMTAFDAINHALTTMATGGFSTRNASMAAFDVPFIQYIVIVFMFIAGTNYTVIYFALKGQLKKVWGSDEFRLYLVLVFLLILFVTISVQHSTGGGWERSFRDTAFQIVSIITTTGFVSADYTQWASWITMLFFVLLFTGACAGSTSGGIKLVRHLVFLKNSLLEFKRILHPRGMIRIKINKQIVAPRILTHILVFLLVYLILFVTGSLIVNFLGMDFLSAASAVATSLGNVGPGIGTGGPVNNFAGVPDAAKWLLSIFMLMGRLELFTILVIFSPYFWKSN